jgi:hypothetical protein
MKKTSKFIQLAVCSLTVIMLFSFIACNEERVIPEAKVNDLKITFRTDGPVSLEIIKKKVADRDNIPLDQILTCIYFGQTTLGFWEYHLTTMFNGPKIYTITSIIGDVNDGF